MNRHMRRVLSAMFVAVGVILLWRGIWGLADVYLFPHNYTYSLLVSVVLGLAILLGSHTLIRHYLY